MNWHEQFQSLSDRDKEEFSRIVSILLEQTFLVRDTWDPKEHRASGNHDYRYAERNLPILRWYLSVGGFELQVDGRRGVIAIYNKYGHNRLKVDKYTTYLMYALRLIYEEQMESASMRREVLVSLRDVLGKLHSIGLIDRRLAMTQLGATLNRLRKLSILARVEGSSQDLDSQWMIYPTIAMAVPDEKINDLFARQMNGDFDEGILARRENEDSDEDELDSQEPYEEDGLEDNLDEPDPEEDDR